MTSIVVARGTRPDGRKLVFVALDEHVIYCLRQGVPAMVRIPDLEVDLVLDGDAEDGGEQLRRLARSVAAGCNATLIDHEAEAEAERLLHVTRRQ